MMHFVLCQYTVDCMSVSYVTKVRFLELSKVFGFCSGTTNTHSSGRGTILCKHWTISFGSRNEQQSMVLLFW